MVKKGGRQQKIANGLYSAEIINTTVNLWDYQKFSALSSFSFVSTCYLIFYVL